MAYIGKSPQVGNYVKLDAITTSSTNTYNLTQDSVAFTPESALHMLVSLNGVIQSPLSSFSVSGSTITFLPSSGTLSSSDTIDFILVLGNTLDIGTPSDSTVTNAKTNFVSTSSSAGLQIKGDGTTDGTLQLNCSQNSHGIKLKSPAHSASQSYTLTFPTTAPSADKILRTDGSGNLSFGVPITEVDQFRLTANLTDAGSVYITSNFERVDNSAFSKIGTGMSESSGTFTFPSTGLYRIHVVAHILIASGNDGACGVDTYFSDDNFSSSQQLATAWGGSTSGGQWYATHSSECFVNVTNISTNKIRFATNSMSSCILVGSTSVNQTSFSFIRLGASQ